MRRILLYLGVLFIPFVFANCASAQAPNISYSSATNVFTVGSAISTLTPSNTGGAVPANTYSTFSTWAGSTTGASGTTNGTGTAARFNTPRWMTLDGSGNMYIADAGNNEIRRAVTSTAAVALVAGSTTGANGTTNATGSAARFDGPYAITFDGSGALYIADFNNNEIRKVVVSTMAVSLLAGSNTGATGTTNGTGTTARFNQPAGIAYDAVSNCLYVSDFANNQIRKVTTAGAVTLFAGSAAGTAGSADGTGSAATFNGPNGIAVDPSGNIYVADQNNNEIRKITPAGVVTTFAGNTTGGSADGVGTAASFVTPSGLDLDISGNIYVTDRGNYLVRMITSAGVVTTVAGTGGSGFTNGVGTSAAISDARGITVDQSSGNIYVADYSNNVIRKMIGTGYSISPALPAGLSFNNATGAISGTPTAISSTTTYTITGFNVSGCSSTTITIQCVQTNNWTGASNTTAWATAGNWSKNSVPGPNDDVQIGVVNYTRNRQPDIAANYTVNSITFGSAHTVTLTINSGKILTIKTGITVNTGAAPVITGGSATSEVDLAPGSITNITGTGTLTLTSPLVFTLQSDATGDASIGQIASGAITGTAASSINVERFITGGSSTYRGYRLLSSPVYNGTDTHANNVYSINYLKNSIYLTSTSTTGGFDNTSAANPTIYLYRESLTNPSNTTFTGGNFRGINNINSSPSYTVDIDGSGYYIPQGNGYLCFFRGDRSSTTFANETVTTYVPQSATLSTSGTLNQGNIAIKDWFTPTNAYLSYTAASPVKGYNLVGNPYACAIDWDTFQTTSLASGGIYGKNISSTIYVLDPVSHNFGSYIANSGLPGTNNASNVISSGQGFFVVAGTATTSTLTFTESAKTTTAMNTGSNLLMGKALNTANVQYLRLRMAKDAVNADETIIQFNSNGSLNYNANLDATYRAGYGAVSLAGLSSDKVQLSVNVIPLPKQQPEVINLAVNANATGIYSITLRDLIAVPKLYEVWLMDKYRNDSLDMRQNKTYQFQIVKTDSASFGSNRFTLVIRQNPGFAYRLLDFAATKLPDVRQAQTTWITENEENYTRFTVERSIDNGKTFDVLGGVVAADQGKYSLVDKNPANGLNMYRLKQEDINNAITYSKVVSIEYADRSNNIAANLLSIYPNPANDNLSLTMPAKTTANTSSYDIKITNSSGVIVRQISSSQVTWQGSINDLKPGTYFVQVVDSKTSQLVGQNKFVKL
ncbi:T9SS type A sorting domain-containing protein [Mucilaginibacter sp.]|uniref:NHL domain-containing protein n=1 Tax=Mucilaginibacter sp. TaxID=1882438 RepID=UPI002C9883AF|nr:T9SS type A sorting domain-containing protein [Mucilaginibacter sp.]HTI59824.1 T9SS type A sorting domain-containing protein [Mucilaginibacter sp.]